MTDKVSPETRSRMMSGIRGKNTKPELIVRKALFRRGFRYQLHRKDLPGKPDLVLPQHRAVVFVNGCFWHGHDCHLFKWPKSNPEFWREKITGNKERDSRNVTLLKKQGWRVRTVWECSLKGKSEAEIDNEIDRLAAWLKKSQEAASVVNTQGTSSVSEEFGTYDSPIACEASLNRILQVLGDLGADRVYAKRLAPNDNSKNQPYFGFHLSDLSFLPTGELEPSLTKSKKTSDPKRQVKYQAPLNLSWVDASGNTYDAPHSKLIYYPQYPEVRFSGFIRGSRVNASEWMDPYKQGRAEGRWLLMGVNPSGRIYAYLAVPHSNLARELEHSHLLDIGSVLQQLDVEHTSAGRSTEDTLKARLLDIHSMGWVAGQKMNADLSTSPYKAQNGGGYTLEALLGVPPNGYAEPDFLGWEVKQFGVGRFPRQGAKPTTLMTPEPDGGLYRERGVAEFVRRYGYPDKSGKPDRLNIGGKHVYGTRIDSTGLTLSIFGFDTNKDVITDVSGAIALLDDSNVIAASWSFAKLMDHWKRKHSQAVYIPCLRRTNGGVYEYHYGKDIELGTGTDFRMVLSAMKDSTVYYDPGIKLEMASSDSPRIKRRSQFRINHRNLNSLYQHFRFVDISGDC